MKSKRPYEPQLILTKAVLAAGEELPIVCDSWCFLTVTHGVAYWLHPRANHELVQGTALLVSARATGTLRATQVSQVTLHYFRINPGRLTGLITWGELQKLERVTAQESSMFSIFSPDSATAQLFKEIASQSTCVSLPTRLSLLDVFIRSFSARLWNEQNGANQITDARMRLVKLLKERPPSELIELSFGELVQQVRCTPRHLSRIFREVVGMSFRERQAEIRLARAQELLATTESKVVEIALESGYQSLSLFNLMFKRQFGETPARWREQKTLKRRVAV
jgi:AraC-like DNA-binding protein